MDAITNTQNVIDSRDVIERIAELRAKWDEATGDDSTDYSLSGDDWRLGLDDDEAYEIVDLLDLATEGENNAEDWQYGAQLIRESYFEDYARDLAESVGAIPDDAGWPCTYIDWERAAAALADDYSTVEFGGVTYYVR